MPIPKCFVSILLKAEGKEEEEDEEKNPLIKKNQIFKMVFSEAFCEKSIWGVDIPVGRT
jgi:hypothetical protein